MPFSPCGTGNAHLKRVTTTHRSGAKMLLERSTHMVRSASQFCNWEMIRINLGGKKKGDGSTSCWQRQLLDLPTSLLKWFLN